MKHIPAIDGLRAWMAWWVVVQHVLQISGIDRVYPNIVTRFLTMGGLAVLVFAAISGFVITHLLFVKKEPYVSYILRRFLRIYPLYAVAVVVSTLLGPLYAQTVVTTPWAAPEQITIYNTTRAALSQHVALHGILAHGLVPNGVLQGAIMSILAPAWSLSLEWQYYLIAPLLTAAILDRRPQIGIGAIVACMLATVLAYRAGGAGQWEYPAFLPLVLGFFLLGLATRVVLEGIRDHRAWLPIVAFAVNVPFHSRDYAGGHLLVSLIPVAIWFGVVVLALHHRRFGPAAPLARLAARLFEARSVVLMGQWSYSTYLLHIPLFVVALSASRELGVPQTSGAYFMTLAATLPILAALSWLSFRYIEQPGSGIIRWFRARPA